LPSAITPKITLSRIPPKAPKISEATANPLVVCACGGGA
jgi:hypothetical protein